VATRLKLPLSLVLAALCAAAALVLPPSCRVNELGHVRAPAGGNLALGAAPLGAQAARFEAACGPPSAPGDAPPVHRPPYLQKVTTRSAAVLWVSEALGRPQVAVWPAGAPASARVLAAAPDPTARPRRGVQYQALLRPLEPGAMYCYEVRDGRRRLAGPFGMTAAPPGGVGATVRIAALGDMGYRTSDQRAVLAQLERTEFDLALLTGDIAYNDGELDEYEKNFFDVYGHLMRSAPFYPAAGNHDYRTDDGGPFRQVFALPENGGPKGRERWYSFDHGDVHVVVLDTDNLGEAQEAWLEADLARNRNPWVIGVLHRPPFSAGRQELEVRSSLHPILARHRVPLVLAGHDHHYERREPVDGVTYVITGGGGRGTRPVGPGGGSAFAAQVAHHLLIVVERDRLRLWAIDATGATFDTLELARPGARAAGTP